MPQRFRVAGMIPRKLEELGVSPRDVLRHAGLPAALFQQEKILVTTEELFALYRGIGEASRDPAIGLALGTEARVERYDAVRLAAVSARTFATRCSGSRATSSSPARRRSSSSSAATRPG